VTNQLVVEAGLHGHDYPRPIGHPGACSLFRDHLELESESKLNFAWRVTGGQPRELSEVCASYYCCGRGEAGGVGQIEEFRSELQGGLPVEHGVLKQ
jgi:hypothetical protein